MEIAKQIIKKDLSSTYLQQQVDTLEKICEALRWVDSKSHLTHPQQLLLKQASEVLAEFTHHHQQAMSELVAHEKEKAFLIEKANRLLEIKSATMGVAAKIALVGYQFPRLMKRGQLTLKSDAVDLIGDKFRSGLTDMARDAVAKANTRELSINEAVDVVWNSFEAMRPSFEKELAVRIHGYTRQLARIAKMSDRLKESSAPG